jgi:hypothetical protein
MKNERSLSIAYLVAPPKMQTKTEARLATLADDLWSFEKVEVTETRRVVAESMRTGSHQGNASHRFKRMPAMTSSASRNAGEEDGLKALISQHFRRCIKDQERISVAE